MYISNMKLINFRNYIQTNLSFHHNINIIIGDNAQGKTSLLEAVYVLARGKSYKNNLSDLIQWEKEYSIIEGNFNKKISMTSSKSH